MWWLITEAFKAAIETKLKGVCGGELLMNKQIENISREIKAIKKKWKF